MTAPLEKAASKNWLKLAVIPLLLGVFGFVLWSNLSPVKADLTVIEPVAIVRPTTTAASPPPTPPTQTKQKRVAWPKFSHEQILATNPFRGSSSMREALKPREEVALSSTDASDKGTPSGSEEALDVDPWAALLLEFPGNSRGVYIESSKGPAYKIGTRLLQVGDRIGSGYRVTSIRPDGIVVETAPAPK